MSLEGLLVGNRYRILQYIGEGGMSRVYKAEDTIDAGSVAIKFMKENLTSHYLEDIIRFKKEVEIASKLDYHGVARIFGSGEYEGMPYAVIELLDGQGLDSYMQEMKFSDYMSVAEIFSKLAGILEYIHSAGIVHRDIKPGNFFVCERENEISFKLLDFGVAHIMELAQIKGENEITGTFGYMSPEATGQLSAYVDERSDLYSLGAIFYQFLTESLPFKGEDVGKLLHQQVATTPVSPEMINPSVPAILGKITMKLLMKDPDSRYQSAKGLYYDINRFLQGEKEFLPGSLDHKARLTYRARMVGREAEMENILALGKRASQGNGCICFVSGEAGSGKSKLLDELRDSWGMQEISVISGRCLNHRNKTPYQPFRDAVDDYLDKLEQSEAKTREKEIEGLKKCCDFGGILVRLNPRIKKFIGEIKELTSLEPERENKRFLSVLSDFFCNLAKEDKRCIITIDDLQWADEGSLSLLAEIAAGIDKSNLLVVATYRDNDPCETLRIKSYTARLQERGAPITEINLQKLDSKAVNRLTECLLGDAGEEVGSISEYLYEKSGGNPFFAVNMLRELAESGIINRNAERWCLETGRLDGLPVPAGIVDIILMRIAKIDEALKELLCKAAIIGREFDIELLHSLLPFTFQQLVETIDQAISLQFLETCSYRGRFLFAHDRVRDAFFYMIGSEERLRIHKSILNEMERLNIDDPGKVIFELTYHAVEAEEHEKILKYAILAAEKARASHANEEAARFYSIVRDLLYKKTPKDKDKWVNISENLIELYLLTGRNDEAISLAEAILPEIGTPFSLAKMYKRIGIAYQKKADWDKCEKNIILAMKMLGESFPATKPGMTACILKQSGIYLVKRILSKNGPLKREKDIDEKKEVIWLYETLNWMYVFNDVYKCFYITIAALNLAERIGVSRELGTSLCNYAAVYMILPMFSRALKHNEKALRIRKEISDEWGVAKSLQMIGSNYLWSGDYRNGIKSLEESASIFKKIGDSWETGLAYVELMRLYIYTADYGKSMNYAEIHHDTCLKSNNAYGVNAAILGKVNCCMETGDYAEAEKLLDELLISTRENNLLFLYCYTLAYYGTLHLEMGRYGQAVEKLNQARQLYIKNWFLKDYIVFLFPHLAEASIKLLQQRSLENGHKPSAAEIGKCRRLCADALKRTKTWPNHYGSSLRAAAELNSLIRRNSKADMLFLRSIEQEKKLGRRYENGKCCYEYGLHLELNDRHQESIEYISKAYATFKEIGAKQYQSKCEAHLPGAVNNRDAKEQTVRDRLKSDRRMSTVLTAGRYISSILEPDILLEKVMDEVMELVGADNGQLLLYPQDGERKLEVRVSRNMNGDKGSEESSMASSSIILKVEQNNTPLLMSDAHLEESFKNRASVLLNSIKSVICVPITVKGELMGIIYLGNNHLNGLFDDYDLDIVEMLAGQAGISLQNALMFRRLKIYADEIESSRDEISEWNRKLEQRVELRTEELNKKNLELSNALGKLQEQADMVEELAVSRERNRFAMDSHDNLGHTMTLLIKLLEVCWMTSLNDPEKMESYLKDASRIAREGLEQLRASVKGLVTEKMRENNLITSLKGLIGNFEALGIHVELSVQGLSRLKEPECVNTLYNLCIEAMTNALRHGKAKNISIIIKNEGGFIRMAIFDDGCGCDCIDKGFGLSGMEKRVKALNGDISFSSGANDGFLIRVEIPLVKESNIW